MKGNELRLLVGLALAFWFDSSMHAQTWTQTSAPVTNWSGVACSADGNRLVAVAKGGLIYVSTNAGGTWETTSAPIHEWSCVASSADGNKLVAATYGLRGTSSQIGISLDSGATWTINERSGSGLTGVACSADGTTLAGVQAGSFDISVSTNGGINWIRQWPIIAKEQLGYLAAVLSADGTKFAASWQTLSMSQGVVCWSAGDGGVRSMQAILPDQGFLGRCLACSADGTRLFLTLPYPRHPASSNCTSLLCVSADSNRSWTTFCTDVEDWAAVASSADGTRLVAAAATNVICISTNAGASWESTATPTGTWASVASSADGGRLVAVINGGGIYTWQTTPSPSLTASPIGTKVLLSWTVPSMSFGLQENAELTSTNWSNLPCAPKLNYTNLNYEVSVDKGPGTKFYRLVVVGPKDS